MTRVSANTAGLPRLRKHAGHAAICYSWVARRYRERFGATFHPSRLAQLERLGVLARDGDTLRGEGRRYYRIIAPIELANIRIEPLQSRPPIDSETFPMPGLWPSLRASHARPVAGNRLALSCVVFSSASPCFGIAGDTKPERIADTATPRESVLPPPEPKLVHYFVLRRRQFSWLAIFNPDHVPSCTLRHGTVGRVDESLMGMAAALMTPTVCPGCFIVDVEKPEAHTQRGQYFREQWVGSRRHARDIPEDDPVTGILLLWETYGQTVLLHNSLLQPARRRYVLTTSEQGSSACSQTSIMHHW